jgi:D-tyrosyl-tRNA(Tyr) deacylase
MVIQRVREAQVAIEGKLHAAIGHGLLVLVGFEENDTEAILEKMAAKLSKMRLFGDAEGKMNLDIHQVGGSLMVVSQFTLYADIRKGNRPSFITAAPPAVAHALYETFVSMCEQHMCKEVATGVFGADMQVSLLNDGPVTIMADSGSLF